MAMVWDPDKHKHRKRDIVECEEEERKQEEERYRSIVESRPVEEEGKPKEKQSAEERRETLKHHLQTIAQIPRRKKELTCQVCSKHFTSVRSDAKYCSTLCRVKAFRHVKVS